MACIVHVGGSVKNFFYTSEQKAPKRPKNDLLQLYFWVNILQFFAQFWEAGCLGLSYYRVNSGK